MHHRFVSVLRFVLLLSLGFSIGVLPGGCGKKKKKPDQQERFVGEWVDLKSPERFVRITKNGDAFIWEDNEGKYSAQLEKGALKISAELGEISAQIVESTGHMIVAGHEFAKKDKPPEPPSQETPPEPPQDPERTAADDEPSEGTTCAIGRKAALAVANADPKKILAGKHFIWDPDLILAIKEHARTEAQNYAGPELNDTLCSARIFCKLPKLGSVYNWFWTRAVAAAFKEFPDDWQHSPVARDAVSLGPVKSFEMGSMGADPALFPELKIKQMAAHRLGCKATVEVKVKRDFAGFLTFHFWGKTGCKFIPADPAVADSQPRFQCEGERQLEDADHTQTYYIQPYPAKALKKKGKTYFTGNPGTYVVEVWAHNPIDEKTFGEHKQFENEAEIKKYPIAFCPKYTGEPMNDGCGCIGLVKDKITVTVDPDPFFEQIDEEGCKDAPGL